MTPDFHKALEQNYPGVGEASFPIDEENWITITDGMAQVTEPGAFHTAGSAHLDGIDFAGKTGTAQVVSHDTLSKMAKTHATNPNVWFVGVTPRRNPELVVAVLWQNGGFSYYPARIGAQVVEAYVEKKRRQEGNLPDAKLKSAVDVGAIWTVPASKNRSEHIEAGHFYLQDGQIVAANQLNIPPAASPAPQKPGTPATPQPIPSPWQLGLALPWPGSEERVVAR